MINVHADAVVMRRVNAHRNLTVAAIALKVNKNPALRAGFLMLYNIAAFCCANGGGELGVFGD